jgi:phosphomannomutase
MKDKLISTVSGIRGVIGQTLTVDIALKAGKAYGAYIKGKRIVVGGDSRTSHIMLKSAVISGLISQGCDVVDIGICPTPTIEMAIVGEDAFGGVGITASHNPIEWNGLKFFNKKGEFLTQRQYDRFKPSTSLTCFSIQLYSIKILPILFHGFGGISLASKKVLNLSYCL